MSRADKWIRGTIVAVIVVAGVAASFSYLHALDVIGRYSQPSRLNVVFPLTVDGLIYCGSMVLLNDARRGADAHKLAYWMLGLGIAARFEVTCMAVLILAIRLLNGEGMDQGCEAGLGGQVEREEFTGTSLTYAALRRSIVHDRRRVR